MQYLTMLKMREDVGTPPPDFYEAMGSYIAAVAASGRLVTTGGLFPSATGVEVRASAGTVITSHGPFTEGTELVGGYAIFEVGSPDEALTLTTDLVRLHVDHWPGWEGACELRQVLEPPRR